MVTEEKLRVTIINHQLPRVVITEGENEQHGTRNSEITNRLSKT